MKIILFYFIQLCNSVTVLLLESDIGGESWETRYALGLQDGVHYLAISSNSSMCSDLRDKVIVLYQ